MNPIIQQCLYAYFYFILYSFGGWVVQGLYVGYKQHKFLNTGFFHGPYVPIFGVGCLLIIYIVDPLSRNPFLVFINTFWITSVIEYWTSWYLQKKYHRLWWDYSNKPFNIHGRVCLLNSTLYGIAGLVITFFIQPYVQRMTIDMPIHVLMSIELIWSSVFWTDVIITNLEMHHHLQALEELHEHVKQALAEKNEKLKAEYVEMAKLNLEKMKKNSRHLKAFVHQRLENQYEESIQHLEKLRSELRPNQK
ncbi:putative ABC transporter permease [Dubosiella newyorkensis]|uniref:putative ABC transporter permease n=1 Tax=Dubosiella newyorkensis TaxID=1862672 RepID=UPI0023F1813C|nr:putative ABC transporter permease [Dubosiella newyorkensis]